MFGSRELRELVAKMVEAMRKAPGVGLAAPQIGVPLRVIVLEDDERLMARLTAAERQERGRVPFPLKVLVNPTLEIADDASANPATFFEGCLSVPGYMALVPRAREVVARGVDEEGAPIEWRASGWPARILQHEVDHVDGTLYVDRMLSRSFASNAEIVARWMKRPVAEVVAELHVRRI